MDDSQVREGITVLATAYRELATLLDRAELEGFAREGQEGHLLALRKACRDLDSFAELVGHLEAEAASRVDPVEYIVGNPRPERVRAVERAQLEAVLRTQERLLRAVGVDGEAASRLVADCRELLEPPVRPAPVFRRQLADLFPQLAAETCRLAEELEARPPPPREAGYKAAAEYEVEASERRARSRRVLRIAVRALAAAIAVGIGLAATPLVGAGAAAVFVAVADVTLDELSHDFADAFIRDEESLDDTEPALTVDEESAASEDTGRIIGELDDQQAVKEGGEERELEAGA
jgi:hypothetical protein